MDYCKKFWLPALMWDGVSEKNSRKKSSKGKGGRPRIDGALKKAPTPVPRRAAKRLASAADAIRLFGGVANLARALAHVGLPKDQACIHRWIYAYPKGTSGRIPRGAWEHVKIAAKRANVDLSTVRSLPARAGYWDHPK